MVATTPVTIEQAAAILGLSTSTVRRRIRDGIFRVEEVRHPQGIMRLVYLPDGADPGGTQVSTPDGVVTTTPATSPGDSMIAYTQTLLLPLVGALERSQATVREQAETIGALRAELAALISPQTTTAPQPEPEAPELTLTTTTARALAFLRRMWPLVAFTAALVLAGLAVVLAWVR